MAYSCHPHGESYCNCMTIRGCPQVSHGLQLPSPLRKLLQLYVDSGVPGGEGPHLTHGASFGSARNAQTSSSGETWRTARKGSVLAMKAVGAHDRGSVFAMKTVGAHDKGGVFAMKIGGHMTKAVS